MALLLVGAASCSDSESGNGLAAEPELISIIPVSGASGCTAIISRSEFRCGTVCKQGVFGWTGGAGSVFFEKQNPDCDSGTC